MGAHIELTNISKSFGRNRILSRLNLTINKGEIYGLIGPSGCGKSTLMKILLGIYEPDSGKISINDRDYTENIAKIRNFVGFTTQENSFYGKLTVYENMRYYANLYSLKRKKMRDHLETILRDVELFSARKTLADNISGGMKRRLDFAISLIHDPDILVLDEPTTGLDPLLVAQFWQVVRKVQERGKTVLVSSHIFSEIEESCTKVGIMNKGTIVHEIDMTKNTKTGKSKRPAKLYPIFKRYIEK
ncbi:MAG: ABC transporter ATP-binding protein [Nanoarchaeota archaeon]|nr:ABC transporter ATP-binding protein [Nanoarchaeota archaeon]